jgi:hypothetical protein
VRAGFRLKQDTLETLISHLLNLVLLLADFFFSFSLRNRHSDPFFIRINFEIADSSDTGQDSVDGVEAVTVDWNFVNVLTRTYS